MKKRFLALVALAIALVAGASPAFAFDPPDQGTDNATDIILWYGDNLTIESGSKDLSELMRDMGTGLIVTEMMGHGINLVTGDFSRGAAGFWVENGEIAYPVEEITVAGNLRDIFMGLVEVGNDNDIPGSTRTGSWLIDKMMIAGN